jgi:hypothetical protein
MTTLAPADVRLVAFVLLVGLAHQIPLAWTMEMTMLVYYVKDGPRPNNSGSGLELSEPLLDGARKLSPADLEARMTGHEVQYLGKEPPEFNKNNPSEYAHRVVIEISSQDSTCSMFDKPGYFLVGNASPETAAATIFKGLSITKDV